MYPKRTYGPLGFSWFNFGFARHPDAIDRQVSSPTRRQESSAPLGCGVPFDCDPRANGKMLRSSRDSLSAAIAGRQILSIFRSGPLNSLDFRPALEQCSQPSRNLISGGER